MQKILFILIASASFLLFTQCSSNDKALKKKLDEMALNLNESAPVMLDEFTRFDGASVLSENTFRYSYTVLNTDNPDSLVNVGLQLLKENIGEEFSTNPDLRIFKKNNVTIEYVYNNNNGELIRSFIITPENYK